MPFVVLCFRTFFYQLHLLTGEAKYADAFETALYNAYLGSLNTEGGLNLDVLGRHPEYLPEALPFDSYSPLVSDTRGRKVGGYNIFADHTYYGCCACIGAAGAGTFPQVALMRNDRGLVFNFYEQGSIEALTPSGKPLGIQMDTAYPYHGRVKLTLTAEAPETFDLTFRVPAWCEGATLTAKGKTDSLAAGYATLSAVWQSGDVIELDLPMAVKRILPPAGAVNADVFAA